jgi:dihydrolipoamide dehydrogenase
METMEFDVVFIGAGPAGYTGAIRAAQLGMRVACVEKEPKLGGTCLRVGCIPSKTLLDATEKLVLARDHLAPIGVKCSGVSADIPTMMARKNKVVETLSGGIAGLFKKNKVTHVTGTATFKSPTELLVQSSPQAVTLKARHFIIATGSVPIELPDLPFDGRTIINSDQAIALEKVPARMVVVGSGAIGLELSSVWRRLGADVTVLELFPSVLPGSDEEMARLMERAMKEQGLKFHFNSQARGVRREKNQLSVRYSTKVADRPDEEGELPADVVLVAVGRRAFTGDLGLEKIGVKVDNRGRVEVDGHFRSSIENIFAVGDVIAGPMLAHKAEEDAVACVERIAGGAGHVDYNAIPFVVYTSPELAWVGRTQEQLKAAGADFKIGKFRFAANSRAICMNDTFGLVKILADAKTDRVLGVHILGPQASSLIAEAVMAMAMGASSEDIARTCHAHPTLPEALREAALGVDGRTINA